MKEVIKVAGAIIKKNDKYLIARRAPGDRSEGFWEFPGGKIEHGETSFECIKRELKEELNIDAEIGKLYSQYIYDHPHISYELFFYEVKFFSGNLKKNVHDKIKWEKLENFHNYVFLPGDGPVIQELVNEM
tara:strand:+ start:1130 stop:1522 length:393 start_codon:yes stop_codon:yes gene_type:complete